MKSARNSVKKPATQSTTHSTTYSTGWILSCGLLFLALQPCHANAQLTELYAFQYNAAATSNFPDGENPMAELIQGTDGNYYTTTNTGGAGTCPGEVEDQIPGCGAVVKITPAGVLSVVYSFPYDSATSTAPNGWEPEAGLVQARDGNFYGVATLGGVSNAICGTSGCGTVFKLTPGGKLTVLHTFCGGNGCGSLTTDGADPTGRLVVGPNGDLYGTTQSGGIYDGFYNQGTIFRISAAGAYTILHLFSGPFGTTGDGANPVAGLTLGSDGNFYGTTEAGGSGGLDEGEGTVFKMTPAGAVTILHSFVGSDGGGADGSYPKGALVEASDGHLYGTCYSGGANGTGTVFRISMKGVFTKIYDFPAEGTPDSTGNFPRAGLIQASDGNLYGTAWEGGASNDGTIYQVTPAGVGTLEASFSGATTGFSPLGAAVQGSDGKLYVTLQYDGGENSDGVQDQGAISVFSSGLPLPAPKILGFAPAKASVGATITIFGGNFVGTTAVNFFGDSTSALFKVDGSGILTVIVPSGANSGVISITNPGGTTSSKLAFTVL
ncbi:MAG TPA: choice-of-anchor tandem repeat GloVer-containing protein [Terriglobales bacterium]|nr:choice-of-anchor tandem repeat GloVer-containing protein [Terriglobales bacterium]